jgi:hypothetical protein
MSKIAIFHGFPHIHFEMIGYVVEYCIQSKIEFDLYANFSGIEAKGWFEWYNSLYKDKLNIKDPNTINPSNYTHIILLTDDDPFFRDMSYDAKIICIDHSPDIRRKNVFARIGTRPFPTCPTKLWTLPSYNIPLVKKPEDIHISTIGFHQKPISKDQLQNMFTGFNDIQFHIMGRHVEDIYKSPNIHCYSGISTPHMMENLMKSKYVLCLPAYEKDYINACMSGSIPLAFTFGCTLIIPKSWNNHYQFKSAIIYDDSVYPYTVNLSDNNESVNNELSEITDMRNTLFDLLIKKDIQLP